MKKILVLLAILALIGCSSPTNTPTSTGTTTQTGTATQHTLIVKNSLWQTVKTVAFTSASKSLVTGRSLSSVSSKELTPEQIAIQAEVDAYNAMSLTDQEWVYTDTAPDLSNAPNGNVFWCDPGHGNRPVGWVLNATRQWIFDNYSVLQSWYPANVLYIDHIPPAPALAKDVTPYEWYAIYAIEDAPTAGVILYEDHCGYTSDETFHGQWILLPMDQTMPDGTPGGGWPSIDSYYYQTWSIYNNMTVRPQDTWPGVTAIHIVTRQVYLATNSTVP